MKPGSIAFILSLSFTNLYGQVSQTLPQKSIVDVWKEIIQCKEPKYELNNIDIVFTNQDYEGLDRIFKSHPIVTAEIEVGDFSSTNIKITNNTVSFGVMDMTLGGSNVTFEQPLYIYADSDFDGVSFYECTFKKFVTIRGGIKSFGAQFDRCKFKGGFNIDSRTTPQSEINFSGCFFKSDDTGLGGVSGIQGNTNTQLSILKSQFSSMDQGKTYISIENSLYSLDIDSTFFDDDISLNQLNIANSFSIQHSIFRNISMIDFVPPPSGGFAADWSQVSRKLCMISTHLEPIKIDGSEFYMETKSKIFNGRTPEDLIDSYKFEKLTASYYNLLGLYKQRGNLKSANACYVEVKDLQTKMLGYEYKTNPTISNFFIWKTSQFLRYFCDYGTNPSKSVIISFYVILMFGGFYFFFYSNWDRINKTYFLNRYLALSKYLSSKTTLGELYQGTKIREINSYTEFKKELQIKKKEVPRYVTFLGHLLYGFSTSRFGLCLWIVKRLDLHKNLWSELKSGKKILVGTIIGLSILLFGIYTILIKALSATMLSLNAFSTLGFGNIPVKGLSKYLTVIEGFLGWLLLSIFSVSLIAQMIQ